MLKREREMEFERRLYDSAATGDVNALRQLRIDDPFILERVALRTPNNNTPLHIASKKGHLPYVEEILKDHNCDLAEELNSQQSSPLHVASARGHVEIAMRLVEAAPHMCHSRDSQGRNPIHVAAIKGRTELLEKLASKAPLAALEKTGRGLTVLHLCVEHDHLEALKELLKEVEEVKEVKEVKKLIKELIDTKNDDGDTILHMAVKGGKDKIREYLETTDIDIDAENSNGQTARSIYKQMKPKPNRWGILNKFRSRRRGTEPEKWLASHRDSIMVVAILTATMAFQAGVTPPGGVWQEDFPPPDNCTLIPVHEHSAVMAFQARVTPPHEDISNDNNNCTVMPHKAGDAVMALKSEGSFTAFMKTNTVAFVSSLSTILLLISGLPFRRPLFMWILMMVMWLTVTTIGATYAIAIHLVTPNEHLGPVSKVINISLAVWCGVMGILLVGNTVRLINKWLRKKKDVRKQCHRCVCAQEP